MTKEQYIKFKEDLKKDIEIVRINKKYNKAWWNVGFKSEDEYNKSYEDDKIKIDELWKSLLKHTDRNKWPIISCYNSYTHVAYYCAKHRLQGIDINNYCKKIFNSMKEDKRNAWPFYGDENQFINQVNQILEAYEKIVYTD